MANNLKGSLLIFGSDAQARKEKVTEILSKLDLKESESNPDLLLVQLLEDKKSLGIDQVRKMIGYLSEKPYQNKAKAVVIYEAQKLTADAQNALLKILEEPPMYASILLCTRTEEELLPTVLSRCQKIRVVKERVGESDINNSIDEVIKMSLGERMSWAETQSKEEKDDTLVLLENWIREERKVMISNKEASDFKRQNIEKILQIKNDLEKTNVGQRLALEFLVLNLK